MPQVILAKASELAAKETPAGAQGVGRDTRRSLSIDLSLKREALHRNPRVAHGTTAWTNARVVAPAMGWIAERRNKGE